MGESLKCQSCGVRIFQSEANEAREIYEGGCDTSCINCALDMVQEKEEEIAE